MNKKSSQIENYYDLPSKDLFFKCHELLTAVHELDQKHLISTTFSVPFQSGLNRTVQVLNPDTGKNEKWLCFDSNGYLGLHQNKKVIQAVKKTLDEAGAGTPSVPILGGNSRWMQDLENKMALFHQRQASMIFSSAYSANLGVIVGLVRPNDAILIDERAHSSLQEGAHLARCENVFKFKTNSLDQIETHLSELRKNKNINGILVIADGIYSMSGQVLDLKNISALTKKYQAKLLVDEAHSVGTVGPNGMGIEEHFDMYGSIDLIIGSFSKAFGFSGGYLSAAQSVVQYLKFCAPTWVFSTSMPSANLAGINKAVDIHMKNKSSFKKFSENRNYLWNLCLENNIPVPDPIGGILPIPIGKNDKLIEVAQILRSKKIRCGVVGFPAVPREKGILRIVPTALHKKKDFEILVDALKDIFCKYHA